ncbi:hypothetical protein EWM64_g8591 [Hericium alpestre]|uniref:DUF6830 domain-containing protein n=1 Tax=Hericium alpestre TaxID=135208 RepID=A0A4Y9ZKY6_9AGAM|nr:hypothetical protein EWM64_g8591 [Hericium alpestre]
MFEHFHIDFAKQAWHASNHRDEQPQMAQWLTQWEKVVIFEAYLHSQKNQQQAATKSPQKSTMSGIHLAKKPPRGNVSIVSIETDHDAPGFTHAIKEYINDMLPNDKRAKGRSKQQELEDGQLSFNRVAVFDNFKFQWSELGHTDVMIAENHDQEVVKAQPSSGKYAARFDTVITLNSSRAESTGIAAYMEWYTPFKSAANLKHVMYSVEVPKKPEGKIIPLTQIRQSCQLIPYFRKENVNHSWTSDRILDQAKVFYVNNWASICAVETTGMITINQCSEAVVKSLTASTDFLNTSVACFSSNTNCVVSGPILQLKCHLDTTALQCILNDLSTIAKHVTICAPTILTIFNVTGKVVMFGDGGIFDSEYYFTTHYTFHVKGSPINFEERHALGLTEEAAGPVGDPLLNIGSAVHISDSVEMV